MKEIKDRFKKSTSFYNIHQKRKCDKTSKDEVIITTLKIKIYCELEKQYISKNKNINF